MIRFDLCGMGVDMLRSCYRTKMRLQTGSNVETDVQWFFCLPGAKIFPGYTRFASGNWAQARFDWPGTGEVLGAPRPFVNGKAPKIGMTGKGFCGKWQLIETGYSAGDPPLPCRSDGKAKCCPPLDGRIGLRVLDPEVRTVNPLCFGAVTEFHFGPLPFVITDWARYDPFSFPGFTVHGDLVYQGGINSYGTRCTFSGISVETVPSFLFGNPPTHLVLLMEWDGAAWQYRVIPGDVFGNIGPSAGTFDGLHGGSFIPQSIYHGVTVTI